ncbi:MAG: hypothetical protein AAGA85_18410 [Bacteroidota bacterium]
MKNLLHRYSFHINHLFTLVCALAFLCSPGIVQAQNDERFWQPVADDVYSQEVGHQVKSKEALDGVGVSGNEVFVIIGQRIHLLSGERFIEQENAPNNVERLISLNDGLWALTPSGTYRWDVEDWKKVDDRGFVDLCMHLGELHAATGSEIFKWVDDEFVSTQPAGGYYNSDITTQMEDGTQIHSDPVKLGPIHRIQSYAGTLHVLRPGELIQFDGKVVNTDFIDWGGLPSKNTKNMLSFGSRLYISTDRGLAELRGATLNTCKGEDGLPVENTNSLARGFDNDLWIGTERGAVRMLADDWHYFGAGHWLPDNRVNAIAVAGQTVYIATNAGLGIIEYQDYTLRKKAAYYERHLEEWGHKRLGFIQTVYQKDGEWIREVSDNDGAHTGTYLAALCFKYQVTKDDSVRAQAVDVFEAMLWLDRITPIDGFIARSIFSIEGDKGGLGRHGSGGLPAKWYKTEDGSFYWKGDTSSDEVIAHVYSVSLFHDLVAQGREKELAQEHLTRMVSYIMENDWVLIDMDGKPTRWGRWNPEYLLRAYGYSDRGVNGLEALAFTQAAYAVSGEMKYREGFQQLVDWGYLNNTLRQKNTFPPSSLAPWDDNLAFEAYNTILRYITDPKEKSYLMRSLERSYEVKRMEHIPWFNFTYGAFTNNEFDLDQCIKHLRAWTLDCTEHSFHNSHRDDLYVEAGYTSYEGGVKAISPRESAVMRGSRRAIRLDGGAGGRRVMEPTGFLRDYWMGRYYGFIEAPSTPEPALATVQQRGERKGAAAYQGPDRPTFQ